jgi:hypothetical protein
MNMNSRMVELLKERRISLPLDTIDTTAYSEFLPLVEVQGSVLVKCLFDRNKHIKLTDFPDRTGYEALINHVHFPLDDHRESLLKCLSYATNLQRELTAISAGRRFLVVVSAESKNCVVRFYQVRPKEDWISDNLEGYKEEAVLVLPVEPSSVT